MKDTYTKAEVIILLASYADDVMGKPVEQDAETMDKNIKNVIEYLETVYEPFLERWVNQYVNI